MYRFVSAFAARVCDKYQNPKHLLLSPRFFKRQRGYVIVSVRLLLTDGFLVAIIAKMDTYVTKYWLFKKAGGRLALSLYVFLPTACFYFELLELVHVDLF